MEPYGWWMIVIGGLLGFICYYNISGQIFDDFVTCFLAGIGGAIGGSAIGGTLYVVIHLLHKIW